jgi:hypothetical protein
MLFRDILIYTANHTKPKNLSAELVTVKTSGYIQLPLQFKGYFNKAYL